MIMAVGCLMCGKVCLHLWTSINSRLQLPTLTKREINRGDRDAYRREGKMITADTKTGRREDEKRGGKRETSEMRWKKLPRKIEYNMQETSLSDARNQFACHWSVFRFLSYHDVLIYFYSSILTDVWFPTVFLFHFSGIWNVSPHSKVIRFLYCHYFESEDDVSFVMIFLFMSSHTYSNCLQYLSDMNQ